MLLSKTAMVKCAPVNKKHIESKGYVWEKGKEIEVKVEDLTPSSIAIVESLCDYCHKNTKFLPFNSYNQRRSKMGKDCCRSCSDEKRKEISKVNGSDGAYKYSENFIKEYIERERGYKFIKITIKNSIKTIHYECIKHGLCKNQWNNIFNRNQGCKKCADERYSRENSYLWKGGISQLSDYLRDKIIPWKKDSMKSSEYKCAITGEEFDDIHHLYPFNKILKESLDELNMTLKGKINEYTNEELKSLEEKILEIHYRYPLGVCLTREIHKEFHSIYGKENFTPDDFYNFKQMKLVQMKEVV